MPKKKVVIIGAGPAGLTAAYELVRDGGAEEYEVTVLEATGVVGGISRTVEHNGNRMDMGGHRFFSKDDRVMDWWREVLPLQGAPSMDDKLLGRESELEPGGPDPEVTDDVMLVRHRVSRIYWNKRFFDYPVKLNLATLRAMGFVQAMRVGFSYLWSLVHKVDEEMLEGFYVNRFGRVLYSMFFESYTAKLWGRHPREISAAWGAQRVKGLSVAAVLKDAVGRIFGKKNASGETSLIESFWYPKHGPGQLWETVAARAQEAGAELVMGAEVVRVNRADGHLSSVVARMADGSERTFEGDFFLSTMPVKDLVQALDEGEATASEPVPARMRQIADGLPYRNFVTVGLLVDRLELQNTTDIPTLGEPPMVPDCWIYVQDGSVKVGRIQIFNNWSPYLVADPEHSVWFSLEYFCGDDDELWHATEDQMVELAVAELRQMGILGEATQVRDAHLEHVIKAYPAYFDTWNDIDELTAWLDGLGNLYCIGRNGQHRYNNMDHSMACAFEAVDNIRTGREDKANIWSVNTEQSYHEEKQA